jgi:uncharacterized repeat protein (TIGR01451 family)
MKIWQRTIAAIATFALLVNSFAAPITVLAQTTTPEPTSAPTETPAATETPTTTPDATIEPTLAPTVTPDASPIETIVPSPDVTPVATDSTSPIPSDQPVVTQSQDSNPTTQGPPSDSNQSTASEPSANPSVTPTVTPTFSPKPLPENATVSTTVVSTNLFPSTVQNDLFKLITDKLDYSPSEEAIITGSNFTPNKTYSLTVSSTDDPATSTTIDITTDGNGSFTHNYQLDGNYRPNYKVEVKDGEVLVASTSFTDSNPTNVTFCHATPPDTAANGWNSNTTSGEAILQHDNGHDHHDADIIPAFDYGWDSNHWDHHFDGKNLSNTFDGSTGQQILDNHCVLPPPSCDSTISYDKTDDFSNFAVNIDFIDTSSEGNPDSIKVTAGTGYELVKIELTVKDDGHGDFYNYTSQITNGVTFDPSPGKKIEEARVTVKKVCAPTTGTITVHKDLVGTNIGDGLNNFCFTLSPNPGKGQICADAVTGNAVFSNVPKGDYTASETQGLSAYTITGNTCSSTISIVNNGDNATCTITNTRNTGTIELKKIWSGTPGQTTLNIGNSAEGTSVTSVTTGAAGADPLTTGVKTVNTGAYYVSETGGLTNYSSALNCTDNGQAFTPGVNDSFTVVKDHAYVCTFTNTSNTGTIEIKKVITPHNTNTFWNFGIYDGIFWDTWKTDGYDSGPINVAPGKYNVVEQTAPGTDGSKYISTVECKDGNTTVATGGPASLIYGQSMFSSQFSVASGQHIVCTFTNTLAGTIEVKKVISPHDTTSFWNFGIDVGVLWDTWKTDGYDSGPINVFPGNHNVTEQTAPGTDGTKYSSAFECKDGERTVAIGGPASLKYGDNLVSPYFNVASGQHIICTFTNTKLAKIIVKKEATPIGSGVNQNFNFSWAPMGGSSSTQFSLAEDQQYDTGFIPAGTYTVTEPTVPTGWEDGHSIATCDNGQNTDNLTLSNGDVVTCTFVNIKQGSISGIKFNDLNNNGTKDAGESGINGWQIFIDQNSDGILGAHEQATTTDSNGNYSFINLPNKDYRVCETEQNDWTRTYPTESNCQTISVAGGTNSVANFGNHEKPSTIIAQKIVCNNESDLPNWGNHGASIGADTAQNYVDSHQGCQIVNGWNFQWAQAGAGTFDSFQTNTASLGTWTTFGPTTGGTATATIDNPSQMGGRVEAREVFLNNNYVPFSGDDTNNVSAEFYCTGDVFHYDNWEWINNPQPGATYYCVAFNALKTGSVTVTKFNDLNQNGTWDRGENGEPTLDNWNIVLDKVGQPTVAGETTFSDLTPGKHILNETLQPGYLQTDIYCDGEAGGWNEDHQFEVNVSAGVNTHCYIGNFQEKSGISITKTNNRGGGMSAGSVVDYTITLTNNGNITLNDVAIQDVIPSGFTYVTGSTTGGTTSDPLITGSVLKWTGFDPLATGASITIHYQTKSSSDLIDGLYTNFATCTANKDYANFRVSSDELQQGIKCNTANSVVKIGSGTSFGGSLRGQVLGISTVLGASTELPGTGSPTGLLVLALGLLTAGFVINKKYVKN